MCFTAMISNWRIDYSKYSVSITNQNNFFLGGGRVGAPQMRYETNFVSSPPTLSHFRFLLFCFFSFSLFHIETTTFSISLIFSFLAYFWAIYCIL